MFVTNKDKDKTRCSLLESWCAEMVHDVMCYKRLRESDESFENVYRYRRAHAVGSIIRIQESEIIEMRHAIPPNETPNAVCVRRDEVVRRTSTNRRRPRGVHFRGPIDIRATLVEYCNLLERHGINRVGSVERAISSFSGIVDDDDDHTFLIILQHVHGCACNGDFPGDEIILAADSVQSPSLTHVKPSQFAGDGLFASSTCIPGMVLATLVVECERYKTTNGRFALNIDGENYSSPVDNPILMMANESASKQEGKVNATIVVLYHDKKRKFAVAGLITTRSIQRGDEVLTFYGARCHCEDEWDHRNGLIMLPNRTSFIAVDDACSSSNGAEVMISYMGETASVDCTTLAAYYGGEVEHTTLEKDTTTVEKLVVSARKKARPC